MVSTSDRKRVISTNGLRAVTKCIIEYPSEKIQKLSEGDLSEEKIFLHQGQVMPLIVLSIHLKLLNCDEFDKIRYLKIQKGWKSSLFSTT